MTTANQERMSGVDTAWLRMDRSTNSMMIVGVIVTETPVRLAAFRKLVEGRFLAFPRFRHRPVADALGASWMLDPEFDLNWHVRGVALPGTAGKQELEMLVAELASTMLDPRRPMWQIHFVEQYQGGSAWVMRLHHCYADGVAMIRVLLSMTESPSAPAGTGAAAGRPREKRAPQDLPLFDWIDRLPAAAGAMIEKVMGDGARLVESGLQQLLNPEQAGQLARQAGGMMSELAKLLALPDDPATPLRGDLSGYKAVAWADPLPLHEVRTVGKALDCTINDVLLATVAGALGAYLRQHGTATDELTIRAAVPVNLRRADEPLTLGNKFGLVFVALPIGVRNPLERLYTMHSTMNALKGSMQPPTVLALLSALGMLPAAVQDPAIEMFSRKGSAVVSNVPGPQAPMYLCGQKITEMYFWVPQSGSMGIGISVLTYAGRVHVGMISDRKLVAKPHDVVDRFAGEFEKLLLAVTVGALAVKELEASKRQRTAAKTTATRRKPVRKAAAGKLRAKPRAKTGTRARARD